MDNGIFQLIDQSAGHIASDLDLVINAIDGAYARIYRQDPTVRGLNAFLAQTVSMPESAHRLAETRFDDYHARISGYRTAFNPEAPSAPETLKIALQQLRVTVEALRLHAARRFKAALVSRSSIAPPSALSLRVMNRAGHRVQGGEMLILIARKALIDVFNEGQIDGLLSEGVKVAQVQHRNPEHDTHGALILIDGSLTGLPHYLDVADKWFHPRSNALIAGAA